MFEKINYHYKLCLENYDYKNLYNKNFIYNNLLIYYIYHN